MIRRNLYMLFVLGILLGCQKKENVMKQLEEPLYTSSEQHFFNSIKLHPKDSVDITGYSQTIKNNFFRKSNVSSINLRYISNDTTFTITEVEEKVINKIRKSLVNEVSNHDKFDVVEIDLIVNGSPEIRREIKWKEE